MTTYSLPLSKKKRAVKTRPPRDALFIAAACALGLIVLVAVAAAVIPFAGDPAKIVEQIEQGLEKGKKAIYPGEAKFLELWHALAPRLWWKTVLKFEK